MKKLKIVYEDKHILVVEKDAGVLTISTEKEKYNTFNICKRFKYI